mmetsp:Transcript_22188/g.44709  ORF Transcript_22188/g.44709 Transcript_22188/m.44709 type:complete len:209 (-) Transcript_22188:82-708(-)
MSVIVIFICISITYLFSFVSFALDIVFFQRCQGFVCGSLLKPPSPLLQFQVVDANESCWVCFSDPLVSLSASHIRVCPHGCCCIAISSIRVIFKSLCSQCLLLGHITTIFITTFIVIKATDTAFEIVGDIVNANSQSCFVDGFVVDNIKINSLSSIIVHRDFLPTTNAISNLCYCVILVPNDIILLRIPVLDDVVDHFLVLFVFRLDF